MSQNHKQRRRPGEQNSTPGLSQDNWPWPTYTKETSTVRHLETMAFSRKPITTASLWYLVLRSSHTNTHGYFHFHRQRLVVTLPARSRTNRCTTPPCTDAHLALQKKTTQRAHPDSTHKESGKRKHARSTRIGTRSIAIDFRSVACRHKKRRTKLLPMIPPATQTNDRYHPRHEHMMHNSRYTKQNQIPVEWAQSAVGQQ